MRHCYFPPIRKDSYVVIVVYLWLPHVHFVSSPAAPAPGVRGSAWPCACRRTVAHASPRGHVGSDMLMTRKWHINGTVLMCQWRVGDAIIKGWHRQLGTHQHPTCEATTGMWSSTAFRAWQSSSSCSQPTLLMGRHLYTCWQNLVHTLAANLSQNLECSRKYVIIKNNAKWRIISST